MIQIKATEIDEAYLELVNKVLNEGEMVRDERGHKTLELMNIITEVIQPIPYSPVDLPIYELINPPFNTFWKGERLEKYCKELVSPERNGFIYTYGNRYRDWFGVDQIQEAITRLNNCSATRRAISTTWDCKTDTINNEVPCMILVDFKVRHNKLQTTALWRSHDVGQAWYANAIGLTYLAQYVAKNTDSVVGSLIIHSISAHIYYNDIDEAKKVIE
jgi:thymidylate synthase